MRLALQALGHPTLWWPLLAAGWRFRARGWARMAPFLPLPPAPYVAWRLHTAYGEEGRAPTIGELGRYLRWVLRMNRLDRHR